MANYLLKEVTDTYSKICLSCKDVGFVRKTPQGENIGKWVGRIGGEITIQASKQEAFYEIVSIINRIHLCGSNNKEEASKALEARNQRVKSEVEQHNKFLRESVADIPYDASVHQVLHMFERRVSTVKIRI